MLVRIGRVLERNLKQLGVSNRIKEKRAIQIWFDEVGPEIAKAAKPLDSREGILFVAVRTPAWSQQLIFLKKDLLARLNRRLGRRAIKDIRFKVGIWPESPPGGEDTETLHGSRFISPGHLGLQGQPRSSSKSGASPTQYGQSQSQPGRPQPGDADELAKRLCEAFGDIPDERLKGAFIGAVVACKMACERGR